MTRRRNFTGRRHLTVRVKKSGGRRASSHRWLNRQLNDPYVQQARAEGMRSRAAYKLSELDDKYRLLKPGYCVVDLGGAPGGWAQLAAGRVNSDGRRRDLAEGRVITVDLAEMQGIDGVELLQLDVRSDEALARLRSMTNGHADVVISDMAAPATGHSKTDHLRIMALCEDAAGLAFELLGDGGSFVCKVLSGGTENILLASLKARFTRVHHAKPAASRPRSPEKYVVALGYLG